MATGRLVTLAGFVGPVGKGFLHTTADWPSNGRHNGVKRRSRLDDATFASITASLVLTALPNGRPVHGEPRSSTHTSSSVPPNNKLTQVSTSLYQLRGLTVGRQQQGGMPASRLLDESGTDAETPSTAGRGWHDGGEDGGLRKPLLQLPGGSGGQDVEAGLHTVREECERMAEPPCRSALMRVRRRRLQYVVWRDVVWCSWVLGCRCGTQSSASTGVLAAAWATRSGARLLSGRRSVA